MKKWLPILAVIIISGIIALILYLAGFMETMSAEEIKNSIEIIDVETKWVKKYYQPWPPKLTLVPAICFRVKNVSDKPLRYVNFNANYRFRDDYEDLGNSFLAAIRGEAIMPGEISELITLKSNYGVEGKTVHTFKDNPRWRIVFVKLFAVKSNQYAPLGEWEISKKIDFKEPEPVGMEKKEIK